MAQLELTRGYRVHKGVLTAAAVAIALVCLGAGVLVGWASAGSDEATFDTTVTAISSDRDSLCVDRAEESCALPIIRPEDRGDVVPGARVRVREVELEDGAGSVLAFYVTPLKTSD